MTDKIPTAEITKDRKAGMLIVDIANKHGMDKMDVRDILKRTMKPAAKKPETTEQV